MATVKLAKGSPTMRAHVLRYHLRGVPNERLAQVYGVDAATIKSWIRYAEQEARTELQLADDVPLSLDIFDEALLQGRTNAAHELGSIAQVARNSLGNLAAIERRHGDPDDLFRYKPQTSARASKAILEFLSKADVLARLAEAQSETVADLDMLTRREVELYNLLARRLLTLSALTGVRNARPVSMPELERAAWRDFVVTAQQLLEDVPPGKALARGHAVQPDNEAG